MLSMMDFEQWLNSPAWFWFKQHCEARAQEQIDLLLSANPTLATWEMSQAQGKYDTYHKISSGVRGPNGHTSYEDYLLDELAEQIKANGEIQ